MSPAVHRVIRTYTIPQLRGLVRNEQIRVNELSLAMADMSIDELTPAWRVKCEQAEAQLKHYQRLLAAYELAAETNARLQPLSPATTAPSETFVGSLVTIAASSPVNPLDQS